MILSAAKEIGVLVRDRRTRLHLSQQDLAQKVGVSRVWIVQLEKGKPSAQLGLVLRTLKELGVALQVTEIKQAGIDLNALLERPSK